MQSFNTEDSQQPGINFLKTKLWADPGGKEQKATLTSGDSFCDQTELQYFEDINDMFTQYRVFQSYSRTRRISVQITESIFILT